MKTKTIKLTNVEADHILFCLERYVSDGSYWGNKQQFENRHFKIVGKLVEAIK